MEIIFFIEKNLKPYKYYGTCFYSRFACIRYENDNTF